ncbi:hypothetical protein D3880_20455 [Pseudomonas cavernae]|uniref:Uncharacterized protein n=1 Tax=Pseudomonas cavernae TaxID=2320867 RepID=A0A385Z5K7_9PSED|nr:Sbal_3080 family lipoprotein [Pseudomonas cavernae]AYC34599.1 hypothetical protein D3880_20455 [Pseudomonas cavernae]
MPTRLILGALALSALSGCSIHQQVDPAQLGTDSAAEICMIGASGVREGFTQTYRSALQQKGFAVTELSPGSSPSACPLSTTYTGTWKWDLALYMAYAEMRVYQQGRQVGQAVYDSRSGSGRLDKFIDAESKLNELADQLFPPDSVNLGRPAASASAPATPAAPKSRAQLIEELNRERLSYEEYQRRYREITQASETH